EADDVSELARTANPAERDLRELRRRQTVGAVDLGYPRRVDPPRRDAVDRDPVAPDLAREGLGPPGEAGPERVRQRQMRGRLLHGARRDEDDLARAASAQMR